MVIAVVLPPTVCSSLLLSPVSLHARLPGSCMMLPCLGCRLGRHIIRQRRELAVGFGGGLQQHAYRHQASSLITSLATSSVTTEVTLVEVGPRDGLQNETANVPTDVKVGLIDRLSDAGCRHIEATSFVSPKWVPQMADGREVMARIRRTPGVRYAALTPNGKGLEAALAAGVDEVAVFAAASEAFSVANINCSVQESLDRFRPVVEQAGAVNVPVRGYVSCVLGCPYQGQTLPQNVVKVTQSLLQMGCYAVSLGDTIGAGTAGSTATLLDAIRAAGVPTKSLAVHFHDTYGQALANTLVALEQGVTAIDTSVSGLGGCPYAPGASGNVATEDVLYMLQGLGVETGIDLDLLLEASMYISEHLGRPTQSRVARAMLAKRGVGKS